MSTFLERHNAIVLMMVIDVKSGNHQSYFNPYNQISKGTEIYVQRFAVIYPIVVIILDLKGPYNANSTFIVLLYVHMRSWHVSQPTNA